MLISGRVKINTAHEQEVWPPGMTDADRIDGARNKSASVYFYLYEDVMYTRWLCSFGVSKSLEIKD